ncbi:uncharacterized protein LOC116721649 [Xiphophorus hellerii]|uniref:uncharacterized protein LOC116721649 n=1 Tax=Xiphophorus hellerii TaxID=8084 RepID=UPI0013B37B4C|nr:uncharacterized protein LOC116721649 [Xiphophorus hellerii]
MMPRKRMPLIGSSGSRTGPPPFNSTALQQPHLTNRKKANRQPQTSSSSQHHPGPSSILLSDNVTPWGGLAHSESSFTITPPAIPPTRPPSLPPGPQPTVTNPHEEEEENDECSCSGFSSEISSPCLLIPRNNTGGVGRRLQARRQGHTSVSGSSPSTPATAESNHRAQLLSKLHVFLLRAAATSFPSLSGRTCQKPLSAAEADTLLIHSCIKGL